MDRKPVITVHLTNPKVVEHMECLKCKKSQNKDIPYSMLLQRHNEIWVSIEDNWLSTNYLKTKNYLGVHNCKDPILELYDVHHD